MKHLSRRIIHAVTLLVLCLFTATTAAQTRIAILADTHVSPGNKNDEMLSEAVREINGSDCKLVIMAGDLTNEGSDEQLVNVKRTFDRIQKPFFIIPGNHENNWSQSACKTFNDLWHTDRFVTEVDNLIITGINCGPYMKMGDGHIKQEDLSWLKKTLASKMKSGKRVLSICHYPLLDDLDNCNDYVRVLDEFPVIGHFCGHYHSWRKYKAGNIDGVMCRALDMGKGNFGYTILDITSDSVKVFDKELGKMRQLKYAYPISLGKTILRTDSYQPKPEPDGFSIKCVYQDSASVFTRVGIDDKCYYFGNSLGYVKSINKKTNKCEWLYKTNASLFSRPAVKGKYAIVPTADKRLLWIDKKMGRLIYEKRFDGPFVADGIERNGILYQGGSRTFQAWNADKATLVWRYDSIDNYCQASPSIYKDRIVFGAWDTNLRMLNRKTGKLLWKWNNGKTAHLFSPGNCVPIVTNERTIIVAPDRFMTSLSSETGKEIWRDKSYKVRESLGVSTDGLKAYAKTMDGEIICVNTQADSFKPLWVVDAGFGYEHAPCILLEQNGIVYAGSRRGTVVAIDAKDGKQLWSYVLGNSEINGFDVDGDGFIYVSLVEGAIWKIKKTR